jgi:hypothetical protein
LINVENFILLRNSVAANKKFEMRIITHPCGSPACVVGSVLTLIGKSPVVRRNYLSSIEEVLIAEWLGVEASAGDVSFIMHGEFSVGLDTPRETVVRYLDECIKAKSILSTQEFEQRCAQDLIETSN